MRHSVWAVVLLCIPQVFGNGLLILLYAVPDAAFSYVPFRWLSPQSAVVAFILAAYGSLLLVVAGPLASRIIRQCGVRSRQGAIALGVVALALCSTLFFFLKVEYWDLPLP